MKDVQVGDKAREVPDPFNRLFISRVIVYCQVSENQDVAPSIYCRVAYVIPIGNGKLATKEIPDPTTSKTKEVELGTGELNYPVCIKFVKYNYNPTTDRLRIDSTSIKDKDLYATREGEHFNWYEEIKPEHLQQIKDNINEIFTKWAEEQNV
jgi:hypothetical protein